MQSAKDNQLTHSLFTAIRPKQNLEHQMIYQLVQERGLKGLIQELENLKIGKDIFLDDDDFLYLALLDQKASAFLTQLPMDKKNQLLNIANPPHARLALPTAFTPAIKNHSQVLEKDGSGMAYFVNRSFESWERTIRNNPQITFIPKTIQGIQNVIKWATAENKRVRAAGYRHTSSEMYADDSEILLSMLDLDVATQLPARLPKMDPNHELQHITLIGHPYEKDGQIKMQCKIGGSTCNYHFQDWVHDPYGGNSAWALPLNVILAEITFAGTNATICHGAGSKNKTLSDLVTEIEFINVKGELQKVTDKEQIKAAAGCFGLLGVVTSLTLELDQMTYANFKSVGKKLISLTIPPREILSNQTIRHLSRENLYALANPAELKEAFADFVNRCENHYYSEWFWFPLHDQGWINSWQNNGNPLQAVRYPNTDNINFQNALTYLAYLANNTLGDLLPHIRKLQTKIMSKISMALMPDGEDLTCTLEDALHFRKGIQNYRARMMEIEIPLPDIGTSKQTDWSICQKAWWDVIESVYSKHHLHDYPMRTTLEMRIMGGSDMTMAAQKNNKRTCSIEILTPITVNASHWENFLQEILDKWAALKDDQGKFLNIRPHWAKRFDHLSFNRDKSWALEWDKEQKTLFKDVLKTRGNMISISMRDYLKFFAYKDQIKEFKQQLAKICQAGGYEMKDIQNRFSNSFWDEMLSQSAPRTTQQMTRHPHYCQLTNFFKRIRHKEFHHEEKEHSRLCKKVKYLFSL